VRVKLAIALALAIVGAGVLVMLSMRSPRVQGSNTRIELSGNAVPLAGRTGHRCQRNQGVPGGTRQLRLFPQSRGTGPAGPVEVTIAAPAAQGAPAHVVARATIRSITSGSKLPYLDRPIRHDLRGADVCFRNRGPRSVSFAGNLTPLVGGGANPAGTLLPDDVRVDYMRGGNESWWSDAGTVAQRFGLAKTTFFGSWTMWAMFAVLAGLWAAVIVLLVRVMPRT
jgi:hypothetical protein